VLLLSACSEPTPIEKCQQKAVSIGEQYLNYESTGAEAREQLDSIKVPETEGGGHVRLRSHISTLAFMIGSQDASYEEIEKRVEWLRTGTYE
jgi:hypothetical protein